jgi:hypothetical protein
MRSLTPGCGRGKAGSLQEKIGTELVAILKLIGGSFADQNGNFQTSQVSQTCEVKFTHQTTTNALFPRPDDLMRNYFDWQSINPH